MDMRVSSPAPAVRRQQPIRSASRLTIAEGAIVLIALHALVGTGIGAIAGSVLAGLLLGLFTGICAVAAILLISGADLGGEPTRAARRQMPRQR